MIPKYRKIDFNACFFVLFFMVLSGCFHEKARRSIDMDTNYVITSDYVLTKPERSVEIYRFHWIDWRQLANPKSKEHIPPTPVFDRLYRSLDGSYKLLIPRLSGQKVLFDDRQYPGEPTARFIMMDENGWVAGIQSTKIREDYPKDDSLLTEYLGKRRLTTYGSQSDMVGMGRVVLKFFNYRNRLVLEDETFNASMSLPFFLSSGHGFSNDPGNPVRINRCIVRNGYFIEISVYTVSENSSDPNFTEKSAIEISDYILSNMSFE